jgi:hypothetical protein
MDVENLLSGDWALADDRHAGGVLRNNGVTVDANEVTQLGATMGARITQLQFSKQAAQR